MIYTQNDAIALQNALQAPYVRVRYSDLGGSQNASLYILISLDSPQTWKNNIMENSRYARFSVYSGTHKLEQFVKDYKVEKFRKTSAISVEEIAKKLQAWIDKHF